MYFSFRRVEQMLYYFSGMALGVVINMYVGKDWCCLRTLE